MEEDKVIVISGGSEGLGREIAKQLGWKNRVIILARDVDKLNKTASELNCLGLRCDISNFLSVQDSVKLILEKYKRIDVLVNNAGVWLGGELDDNNPIEIKRLYEVNVLGTTLLTREVASAMKQQGYGEIYNIISQDGLYGKACRSVYSSSKWAVTGLTKSLQEEFATYGIKVTGIYPGLMETNLFDNKGDKRDMALAMSPEIVAKTVEWLISLPKNILVPELGIKDIKG